MTDKINKLQSILRERLPGIKRWKKINVYDFETCPDWIKAITSMKNDNVLLHWNGRKRGNIHEYEFKEFPLSDIDSLILRNTERLKSDRKIYR